MSVVQTSENEYAPLIGGRKAKYQLECQSSSTAIGALMAHTYCPAFSSLPVVARLAADMMAGRARAPLLAFRLGSN